MQLITPFNTAKLDKILSDQTLQNEQERQNLLRKAIKWLDEYALHYGIHTAYIFGSLTQPNKFHQNSDVDIAVEEINLNDFFAVMGLLSETMGRNVDITEIHKCHFRERIKQAGIRWTATDLSC